MSISDATPAARTTQARQTANRSIAGYLIQRLQDYGVRDVFGIPGDYVLDFYSQLELSPINVVGCTREDNAGFAADAYARLQGMGAMCVTYCVGGLSVCNSVAGAFAEKSPVVVLTGSPGLRERVNNPLLHHKVREFRTQLEVFEKLCIAATELVDPLTAFSEIDRVLDACFTYKRPVYIEIPRDMVNVVPPVSHAFRHTPASFDPAVLEEAVAECLEKLNRAQRPMIIAGVEIHRFGLQKQVLRLAEEAKIPVAATILGKSVIGEKHPLYIGIYEGAMGHQQVTEYVEQSDCVLLLGAFMTDINLGIYTAQLDIARCIYATSEQLQISHHHYPNIPLEQFLDRLVAARPTPTVRTIPEDLHPMSMDADDAFDSDAPLRVSRLMARINQQLDENTIVIADIGDSLFAASELVVHQSTEFISPAYYTSMGFSVPAALGACVARPDKRVLVVCGDGAFQMTGTELSTLVRHRFNPIVIVLDNHGYGTERVLQPDRWAYNEIHPWAYHQLPLIYGGGQGYLVETEQQFSRALERAWHETGQLHLIQAKLVEGDASRTLAQLAQRLGQRISHHN
jgi:indolepyruvate decarboxylase